MVYETSENSKMPITLSQTQFDVFKMFYFGQIYYISMIIM